MPEKTRLLIIDDEESIRDACSQTLARNPDYSVAAASDAQSGLDMVRKTKPDLVLVDLKLPQMSGIEIIQEIKEIDPSIGSIVITAYPTIAAAVDAIKKGAYDFLPKPFTPDELRYIVKRALETRRLNLESQTFLKGQEATQRYFVSLVAHELRSPLLSIQQYVNAILSGAAGEVLPQQEKIFHRMSSRIEGLTDLINNWLSLNQLKTGKLGGDMKPVQMRPIINEVVEILRPCAHAKGVDITTVIGQDPAVAGNAECLKEMLLNLVGNALKYNREKGSVTIRVAPSSDRELSVSVQDTGCGIPDEDIPRIFDEFFQGENSKSVENGGSGLGLSIVKQVVELHSGRIRVSSKLGQGSVVTVVLPLEAPLPERKHEESATDAFLAIDYQNSFSDDIKRRSGQNVNLCFQCKKCAAGCPVMDEMDLTPSQVIHAIRLGARDLVLDSKTIWICASCETCSTRCPQEVDIARVMDACRILAKREGHTSKVPEVPAFHKSVLENIRIFGRLYELGMIGALKLRTSHYTQDMGLGIRMFSRGKLKLVPRFSRVLEINRIFSRVKEVEEAKK